MTHTSFTFRDHLHFKQLIKWLSSALHLFQFDLKKMDAHFKKAENQIKNNEVELNSVGTNL